MNDIFNKEETDGLLLVDAENGFNVLNMSVIFYIIPYNCPSWQHLSKNFYKRLSHLFVTSGAKIESAKGTTQGQLLAMAAYVGGIISLFQLCKSDLLRTKSVTFADDLSGAERLHTLKI